MALDLGKIAKGIAGTLFKVAPEVAKALPIPGVVGTVLESLGVALTGKDEDQIINEVNSMPVEKLAILKQHEQKMREFEVQERGQDLANVQSARKDTKDISFASPHFALAAGVTLLFAVVIVGVIFFGAGMAQESEKYVYFLLGILATQTERIYNFFFGSSLGSKRKTDMLATGTNP
jgi:hypothetical protein